MSRSRSKKGSLEWVETGLTLWAEWHDMYMHGDCRISSAYSGKIGDPAPFGCRIPRGVMTSKMISCINIIVCNSDHAARSAVFWMYQYSNGSQLPTSSRAELFSNDTGRSRRTFYRKLTRIKNRILKRVEKSGTNY